MGKRASASFSGRHREIAVLCGWWQAFLVAESEGQTTSALSLLSLPLSQWRRSSIWVTLYILFPTRVVSKWSERLRAAVLGLHVDDEKQSPAVWRTKGIRLVRPITFLPSFDLQSLFVPRSILTLLRTENKQWKWIFWLLKKSILCFLKRYLLIFY